MLIATHGFGGSSEHAGPHIVSYPVYFDPTKFVEVINGISIEGERHVENFVSSPALQRFEEWRDADKLSNIT